MLVDGDGVEDPRCPRDIGEFILEVSFMKLRVWVGAEHFLVVYNTGELQCGQRCWSGVPLLLLDVKPRVEVRGQSVDRDLHAIVR